MSIVRAFRAVSILVGTSMPMGGCAHGPAVIFESQGAPLTVHRPALYPETIEYNSSDDTFLLSSVRDGAIYKVDQAGKVSLLVDDPRLCSVLGIAVDAGRRRIWAVNSDLGAGIKPSAAGPKKLAGVGVYDLDSGKPLNYVDLTPLLDGPHLVNGIALDTSGNAFITDSFSPVIYRVTSEGSASIFLKDDRFSGTAVNLNGLIVHPDGYLLVIKKSDGTLFKVPLDRPTAFSKVGVDQTFVGGDGLNLVGKQDLVIIANRTPEGSSNSAFSLSSEDGWVTAKVKSVQQLGDVYPTTAVLRNRTLHVLHSKLNQLIAAPQEQKAQLREQATIRPIGRVSGN
ncbi:MAG TPA: hypothetical protein VJN18_03450 [Polyangiaceae bacterium]|nr:hypothetical protein [Polyangiaceae bacterium]